MPKHNLCFSSFLANNNTSSAATSNCISNYIYPNVKFQAEFPVGTVQGFVTSGNLPTAINSSSFIWGEYGFHLLQELVKHQ